MYLVDVPVAYPFRYNGTMYLRDCCKYINAHQKVLVRAINCKTNKVVYLYPYSNVLRVKFLDYINYASRVTKQYGKHLNIQQYADTD